MTSPREPRYWPPDRAARSLCELAYFERATARALAGWVPKVPQMDIKAQLGIHLYQGTDRAHRLRRSATALARAAAHDPPVPQGWKAAAAAADAAPDVASFIWSCYEFILPRLAGLYREYLAHTDPYADPGARRTIEQILPEVESQARWGGETVRDLARPVPSEGFATRMADLWERRLAGPDLAWTESLWPPLDRVPRAARPEGIARLEVGSLGLLPIDALHDPRDIAMFLHADLDEEFTTLELIARNSYEHPDMPWEFHLDMARHASDEARHALLIRRMLEERGFRYGDFPINTGSYDGIYEFEGCEPGSRKELLWRMLIRQTFMEGLALDSFAVQVPKRIASGQPDIACALDYLLRDEVFHAGSGLKWSRYLLGDDPRAMLQERYEALLRFTGVAEAHRARFVQENLDKAMAELVAIEEAKRRRGGKLPERPINRLARREAGYTDDDMLQVVSWGYADP